MAARPRRPGSSNAPEHKVSGENACRALFLRRPQDIRRVYVTERTLPRFKDVLGYCADKKLAYHVKTDLDLDAVAETVHHDGVLFLALARQEGVVDDVTAFAARLGPSERAALVLLEDVKNPHNLGAILRVCAHFGVPFCLRTGGTPALSPAVLRTAEGGAEHTTLVDAGDVDAARALLLQLRARGFRILATSSHATVKLGGVTPPRSVVMFGSEGSGLSKALLELADDVVAIPGSGALESLNVACASSIVLWELWKGSPGSFITASVAAPTPRETHVAAPAPSPPRPRRTDRGRRRM